MTELQSMTTAWSGMVHASVAHALGARVCSPLFSINTRLYKGCDSLAREPSPLTGAIDRCTVHVGHAIGLCLLVCLIAVIERERQLARDLLGLPALGIATRRALLWWLPR